MAAFILRPAAAAVLAAAAGLYLKKTGRDTKISFIAALILLVLLAAFAAETLLNGNADNITVISFEAAIAMTFTAAWIDLKEKKIPNAVVLTGLLIRIAVFGVLLFTAPDTLVEYGKSDGIALLVMAVFCGLCLLIFRSGIGMGDIKLLLVLALYMGTDMSFSMLFLSLIAAFLVSLFMLIAKKADRKSTIPFAPAILAGTYITIILTYL